MDIKINNRLNPSNLLVFSDMPVLAELSNVNSSEKGQKAEMTIIVTMLNIQDRTDYYITLNGVTIKGVQNIKDVQNTNFYAPKPLTYNVQTTVAYSIAKALNNSELSNMYDIYVDTQLNSKMDTVRIIAKQEGSNYDITEFNTNCDFITYSLAEKGIDSSELNNSKIILNLYATTLPNLQNNITDDYPKVLPYVTQLTKYFIGDNVVFDISSILNSILNYNEAIQFSLTFSYIKGNQLLKIAEINRIYASKGYETKTGKDYLTLNDKVKLLQNVDNGTNKTTLNNTILYYMDNQPITFSLFFPTLAPYTYKVICRDNAFRELAGSSFEDFIEPSGHVDTVTFTAPSNCAYMDVQLPQGVLRYTNIQPKRLFKSDEIQTIYFYNSYGGLSFFNFVVKRELSQESDKKIYTTSTLTKYDNIIRGQNNIYVNKVKTVVELTSHYLQKDAIYTLYDMAQSYFAYTLINNEKRKIIIDDIQVNEVQNGLYQAKVKFSY